MIKPHALRPFLSKSNRPVNDIRRIIESMMKNANPLGKKAGALGRNYRAEAATTQFQQRAAQMMGENPYIGGNMLDRMMTQMKRGGATGNMLKRHQVLDQRARNVLGEIPIDTRPQTLRSVIRDQSAVNNALGR